MQDTITFRTVAVLVLAAAVVAQDYQYDSAPSRPAPLRPQGGFSGSSGPKPTPVPILKQINRHNEDGSYTYGYEGADGAFKIETKAPNGEVKGKYGYVDETGKVRVVEYGANRFGFQPAGEGITVAPPTLVDETTNKDGTLNREYDNGQYYEEPAPVQQQVSRPRPKLQPQYNQEFSAPRFAPAPQRSAAPVPARAQIPGAAPVEIDYTQQPRYTRPQPSFAPAPAPAPRPAPAPARFSFANPAPVDEDITYAQPAPRPAPRGSFAQPVPPFRPEPSFRPEPAYRPAPQQQFASRPANTGRSGGVLDQLAKDYALPHDAAAPLHDISFGYY